MSNSKKSKTGQSIEENVPSKSASIKQEIANSESSTSSNKFVKQQISSDENSTSTADVAAEMKEPKLDVEKQQNQSKANVDNKKRQDAGKKSNFLEEEPIEQLTGLFDGFVVQKIDRSVLRADYLQKLKSGGDGALEALTFLHAEKSFSAISEKWKAAMESKNPVDSLLQIYENSSDEDEK